MPVRDNGFVAPHYVPLADLDPRLADAMLEVLRAARIAAYVEPSAGHLGGYLEVHLPERPRDRLWVDRERHEEAAALLTERAESPAAAATPPEGRPHDLPDDAVWAQLVAGFDLPSEDVVPRWPVAEDLPYRVETGQAWTTTGDVLSGDTAQPSADSQSPVPRRVVRPAEREPQPSDDGPAPASQRSWEYDPLAVLDEHFVPPLPPPPPRMRAATRWAIVAIVGGFGLIIASTFTPALPQGTVAVSIAAILGGFGSLVHGMTRERPDDPDSDDGAVV